MNNNNYKYISQLETKVDYLETEFTYLNDLLKRAGFEQGIKTLKESAIDLIEEMSL